MSGTTQGRIGSLPKLNFKEFARFGAALAVALGLVAGLGAGLTSPAALAQDADKDASGKDAAANQRAYSAGTRAFESGDMATAERQLTAALSGGGLPNSQMARALYLRGSALRRLGKPARAISDLTTAVWLKGGLSDADKAKATEERQLAYREAGLGDTPPPVGAAPLDQSPSTPTKPGGPPKAKPGTQVAVVGPSSFWSGVSMPSLPSLPTLSIPGLSSTPAQPEAAAAAPQQAPAPAQSFAEAPAASQAGQAQGFTPDAAAPAAAASSAAPAESAWQTETAQAGDAETGNAQTGNAQTATSSFFSPQPTPVSTGFNVMPGTQPAAGQAVASAETGSSTGGSGSSWGNALGGTGQAISGFFGNVFGGSGSGSGGDAQAAGNAPVTTGSTGGDGWGSETKVVTSQTSSMVQRGPESPSSLPWSSSSSSTPPVAAAPAAARPTAAKKQVAARTSGGKYKLQVASVRSREEADKLAQTLQGYKAVREGAVSTEVDEAVIGSMGTFYRVRLGPYATAKEPGDLCQTLKPQGFDCLVVTQ